MLKGKQNGRWGGGVQRNKELQQCTRQVETGQKLREERERRTQLSVLTVVESEDMADRE